MKKFTVLLTVFFSLLAAAGPCAAGKIAFLRMEGGAFYICCADSDGKKVTRLAEGYDPDISPDGATVAYTRYDKNGGRFIALYDVVAKKTRTIKGLPGSNSYGPRWSRDGACLLYSRFADSKRWLPEIYDLSSKKYKTLGQKEKRAEFFGPFWPEGRGFVSAFDFENAYKISTADGTVREKLPMKKLLPSDDAIISSAVRMSASPDGAMWLISAETGGERCAFCTSSGSPEGIKGALYLYHPETGISERLKAGGLCVADAAWLNAEEIVFSAHSPEEKRASKTANLYDIYAMKLNGEKPRKIISRGSSVSASK